MARVSNTALATLPERVSVLETKVENIDCKLESRSVPCPLIHRQQNRK